jgi:hypothetical protein
MWRTKCRWDYFAGSLRLQRNWQVKRMLGSAYSTFTAAPLKSASPTFCDPRILSCHPKPKRTPCSKFSRMHTIAWSQRVTGAHRVGPRSSAGRTTYSAGTARSQWASNDLVVGTRRRQPAALLLDARGRVRIDARGRVRSAGSTIRRLRESSSRAERAGCAALTGGRNPIGTRSRTRWPATAHTTILQPGPWQHARVFPDTPPWNSGMNRDVAGSGGMGWRFSAG